MGNNKETKSKKDFSLKISEAFLEGTLFLLFGTKKWQKGKRPIPPIYAVGAVIILLIFILIIKKATTKPPIYYQPKPPPHGGIQQQPFHPGQMPPGRPGRDY